MPRVLYCRAGEHEWVTAKNRGVPYNCPEHQPVKVKEEPKQCCDYTETVRWGKEHQGSCPVARAEFYKMMRNAKPKHTTDETIQLLREQWDFWEGRIAELNEREARRNENTN